MNALIGVPTQTLQGLSKDNGRLAHWQNTPTAPLTQDDYLYDGSGQRAMQYVNVNGSITTTAYLLGGAEESASNVITKYLGVSGLPMAVRVGSTLSYLASDGLGSVSEAFDTNGAETAAQLYAPYGTTRYAAGTMPTAKGFTGQRADVTTGLDYYGARYYDAQAGQFAAADSVANGLSPYAYVAGNPETATDPSGHLIDSGQGTPDPTTDPSADTHVCGGFGVCDPMTGTTVSHKQLQEAKAGKTLTCHDLNDCPLTAELIAKMQANAANTAQQNANFFKYLGWGLGILASILTVVALGTGNPVLAGIIWGIVAGLGVLVYDCVELNSIFQREHDNQSNLTQGSVLADSQYAATEIANAGTLTWLGGAIASLPFIGKYVAAARAGTTIADNTTTAVFAALSFLTTVAVGGITIGVIAQNDFDTEANELPSSSSL